MDRRSERLLQRVGRGEDIPRWDDVLCYRCHHRVHADDPGLQWRSLDLPMGSMPLALCPTCAEAERAAP